jgi:hypothetical protein
MNHPCCISIISTDRNERMMCLAEVLKNNELSTFVVCDKQEKGQRRVKFINSGSLELIRVPEIIPSDLTDAVVIIDISDPEIRKSYFDFCLVGESRGITTILLTETVSGRFGLTDKQRKMQDFVFYSKNFPVDIKTLEEIFETKNLVLIK